MTEAIPLIAPFIVGAVIFLAGWVLGWHRANGLWREATNDLPEWQPDLPSAPKQTLYPDPEEESP